MMSPRPTFRLLLAASVLLTALSASAQPTAGPAPAAQARDGRHDFDLNFGLWHSRITRVLDPLSGSPQSIELAGLVNVRKVWDGRAALEELEIDGPKGHWEGLSVFLYNPSAHQWSQSFINSKAGVLQPPMIGSFKDGRGELFASDTIDGRSILVRAVWSDIKPDSHTYEESYSADGGKTWARAFTAHKTRAEPSAWDASRLGYTPLSEPAEATASSAAARDGQHDFDFDLGNWKTHSSRLLHPLTGSTTWVELDGRTVVKPVWGGRANLAEFKANGPTGPLELLSLRWYNPAARQWTLDFATPGVGAFGTPSVGEFKNGRGDFYDQETLNGKSILVRFSIWRISADTAQSEQAFSDDGGKTWETNWINRYTRDR